jgi:glycosyl transferase family 87
MRVLAGSILCLIGIWATSAMLPEHPPFVLQPWRVTGMMDASAFRAGAQLVGKGQLYNPVAIGNAENKETGERATRVYLRAPWYAIATKWLASPPYPVAMAIWKCLLVVSAILFALTWSNRWQAVAALCWSLPFFAALEQGQDTPFVLLIAAASIRFALQKRDFAAGLIMALATIKPHFLVLVLCAFLTLKRWPFLIGFLLGGAVLAGVSFVAEGWNWPIAYLSQLLQPDWYNGVTVSPNVAGLVPWFSNSSKTVLSACAILVAILPVMSIARRNSIDVTVWTAFALAVVCSFHAYLQDVLLCMPLALCILNHNRIWFRRIAIFSLSPLCTYALAAWIPIVGSAFIVISVLAMVAIVVTSPEPHLTS